MVSAPATAGSEPPDRRRIVEVVAAHIRLDPVQPGTLSGRWRGTCPFCGSRSFHVRPEFGTFHCFHCGQGGDAGAFLRLLDQHGASDRVVGHPAEDTPGLVRHSRDGRAGHSANSANSPDGRRGVADPDVRAATVDGRDTSVGNRDEPEDEEREERIVNDDSMTGPGAHETSAMSALVQGDTEDAKVMAILALAAAVNRLADAQESIANSQN